MSSAEPLALYREAPMPTVSLPPELDRVLRDYERFQSSGDAAGIASLFTDDGLFPSPSGWRRGREAIRAAGFAPSPLRLRPTAYSVDGATGYVAGFFGLGSDPAVPDIARMVLALRRGPEGRWLIAARLGEDFRAPDLATPRTADRLIAQLDVAQMRRAVVLSVAYWFGDQTLTVADEHARVRAENDWVAREVARHPDRLVGFCGVSPLRDYALEEIERCSAIPGLTGLKLHFGNSRVDLLNAQHVQRVRQVFRAANDKRLPVIVHLGTGQGYGPQHSEVFVSQVLPTAPDIPIQVAHLANSYDALAVFAKAAASGDPRMKNLYFDVGGMIGPNTPPGTLQRVAGLLRDLGLQRVLFASDFFPGEANLAPRGAWQAFLRLPLTEDEFRIVAANVAPYMR